MSMLVVVSYNNMIANGAKIKYKYVLKGCKLSLGYFNDYKVRIVVLYIRNESYMYCINVVL